MLNCKQILAIGVAAGLGIGIPGLLIVWALRMPEGEIKPSLEKIGNTAKTFILDKLPFLGEKWIENKCDKSINECMQK